MKYGSIEHSFAEPIARRLVEDGAFRSWLIGQTKFIVHTSTRLLHEEMQAARSGATWWRSHYTEKCRCEGCKGQETDLLAIFEAQKGFRFALHCEVKQPKDVFVAEGRQAENYRTRAACWVARPPRAVLQHSHAATVLLCADDIASKFAAQATQFDCVITFEHMRALFPDLQFPMSAMPNFG